MPQSGLYKPIWEYDAKTLAWDLSGHLAYGAGTGAAFWLLTGIRWPTSPRSRRLPLGATVLASIATDSTFIGRPRIWPPIQ